MSGFRPHEVLIGAVLVVLVAEMIVAAYIGGGSERHAGYEIVAGFAGVDGLAEGSDVRMSGVGVGEVAHLRLDEHLRPVAVLRIDDGVKLPRDTSAAIHTDGLLGEKFVALEPGGDERMMAPGERVDYTQPAVVLEDLLELIVARAQAGREGAPDAQ